MIIKILGPIYCKDGTHLSVQASESHYSTPREPSGPYTTVEVGYPSATPPESWIDYADDPEAGVNSDVFGYVPVELVEEYIQAHGGIDIGKSLEVKTYLDMDKLMRKGI